MAKYRRDIILKVSDPHCGFELGLTNPETKLTDQNGKDRRISDLNESQGFLWEAFENGLKEVEKLAGGDPIHAFFMGDITHGNKFVDQQVTTRMSDQVSYAVYAADPVFRLKGIKSCHFAYGTGVHVFGEGSSEILVSEFLKERYPKINTRSLYHGLAYIGKFAIDYSHHGPHPGTRNWLRGNVARLYLQSKMMDDLDNGQRPADLVARGHYHSFVRTWYGMSRGGEWFESWLIIMPPMCFVNDHARKATQSAYRVSPGIVAVEVINGRLHNIFPFTRTLDIRTVEYL